ncbi:hypothetical protein [Vibrio europaeus]|uniref:hypothetical protein n=2 Tax=Vibrio europaeus TaxID=300876 RepID=UPI00148CAFC6|nr:hypothetical protein [Vibrio europaeus]MDC5819339.1 hypothetical protein [Vibrio europaeus]MDC5855618.1 hypothetical protein [Vibrio europaeus]MDC5872108.1 hypothetical protein [Vibrio europaeus]
MFLRLPIYEYCPLAIWPTSIPYAPKQDTFRNYIYFVMKKLALFTYVTVTLCVLTVGMVVLYQSMYRSAAELQLENLTHNVANADGIKLTIPLSDELSHFPLPTAYDLDLSATLYEWEDYLSQENKYIELRTSLREKSAKLRPTWAPNHVERSKLSRELGNGMEKENLDLALLFGPYTSQAIIQHIDFTFSHWEDVSREFQIKAATQLVGVIYRKEYRADLNNMISFSRGKERMCNLLMFNNLTIESCK